MKIILITQGLSRLLLPLINSGHNVVGIIESMPRDFTENKKEGFLFRLLKKIYSLFNLGFNLLVQQPVILQTILHLVFSFQVFS